MLSLQGFRTKKWLGYFPKMSCGRGERGEAEPQLVLAAASTSAVTSILVAKGSASASAGSSASSPPYWNSQQARIAAIAQPREQA